MSTAPTTNPANLEPNHARTQLLWVLQELTANPALVHLSFVYRNVHARVWQQLAAPGLIHDALVDAANAQPLMWNGTQNGVPESGLQLLTHSQCNPSRLQRADATLDFSAESILEIEVRTPVRVAAGQPQRWLIGTSTITFVQPTSQGSPQIRHRYSMYPPRVATNGSGSG